MASDALTRRSLLGTYLALVVACSGNLSGNLDSAADSSAPVQPLLVALTGDPCTSAAQCNDGNRR